MTKPKKDSLKALKKNIKKSYDILSYFNEDDFIYGPIIDYQHYDSSLEIEFARSFRMNQKSNTILLTVEADNTMFVDSNEREFKPTNLKILTILK